MLIVLACLACTMATNTMPATGLRGVHAEPQEARAMADDTLPFGNRFGFPFTREEYKRALRQIKPEEEAEFLTRVMYEPDPEATGMGIADTNLLLLAALSEDVAQRVIAFRPRLRDAVLWVRQNPEAFVAGFRGGDPPP